MHISNSFLSKLDIDQAPEVMRLVRLEAIDSGAADDARANVWARLASDIEPFRFPGCRPASGKSE